jgi:hypothetical protein
MQINLHKDEAQLHEQTIERAQQNLEDMVYIRTVKARDVMGELADKSGRTPKIDADMTLYALHAFDGVRLALMSDKNTAFSAAEQNNKTAVFVQ